MDKCRKKDVHELWKEPELEMESGFLNKWRIEG